MISNNILPVMDELPTVKHQHTLQSVALLYFLLAPLQAYEYVAMRVGSPVITLFEIKGPFVRHLFTCASV